MCKRHHVTAKLPLTPTTHPPPTPPSFLGRSALRYLGNPLASFRTAGNGELPGPHKARDATDDAGRVNSLGAPSPAHHRLRRGRRRVVLAAVSALAVCGVVFAAALRHGPTAALLRPERRVTEPPPPPRVNITMCTQVCPICRSTASRRVQPRHERFKPGSTGLGQRFGCHAPSQQPGQAHAACRPWEHIETSLLAHSSTGKAIAAVHSPGQLR